METEILHLSIDNLNQEQHALFHSSILLYIQIFSEAPYFEDFEIEEVENDFNNYLDNGCILLAVRNNITIGFLCWSIGKELEHETKRNLENWGINSEKDIYISELGVHPEYRHQGIARQLMNNFMGLNINRNMFLRTGIKNNEHVINFYRSFNFITTNVTEDVWSNRIDVGMTWDTRLYMIKKQTANNIKKTHIFENKPYNPDEGYGSGAENYYGVGDDRDSDDDNDNGYNSGSEDLYGTSK